MSEYSFALLFALKKKKKKKKPVNSLDLSSFRGTYNRTWWVPYRDPR